MNNVLLALQLTGYGLGGVFLSLILLYIMILIMRKVLVEKD
ncbi:MAG: OadG-related small transporter subunit [Eubacteriales bacterium]